MSLFDHPDEVLRHHSAKRRQDVSLFPIFGVLCHCERRDDAVTRENGLSAYYEVWMRSVLSLIRDSASSRSKSSGPRALRTSVRGRLRFLGAMPRAVKHQRNGCTGIRNRVPGPLGEGKVGCYCRNARAVAAEV